MSIQGWKQQAEGGAFMVEKEDFVCTGTKTVRRGNQARLVLRCSWKEGGLSASSVLKDL